MKYESETWHHQKYLARSHKLWAGYGYLATPASSSLQWQSIRFKWQTCTWLSCSILFISRSRCSVAEIRKKLGILKTFAAASKPNLFGGPLCCGTAWWMTGFFSNRVHSERQARTCWWDKQVSKRVQWVSHRSARVAFRWHWIPVSINFPLQLCIDPNRMCPANACVLGRQLVLIGRHQARRNRPSPAFCSKTSASFPGSGCAVSRKNSAEKPEQTDYGHNRSIDFKAIATDSRSSELYIYLSSHLQRRTATLLAFSNTFWHILNHSRSQDFTQICQIYWHPQRTETPPISTCQCPNCLIYGGAKR